MEQHRIKDSLPEIKYRVFLSFFHCPTRPFFGRTSKTEMLHGTNRKIEVCLLLIISGQIVNIYI